MTSFPRARCCAPSRRPSTTVSDPSASAPQNDLGCLYLYTGDGEAAVPHLKKATELRPKEPNPVDSLGEAYLTIGKFDDAQQAFEKALEVEPSFMVAWTGIAFTQLCRGDAKKGLESLAKYREAKDVTPGERSFVHRATAWTQLSQNKLADGLKTVDGWDAEAAKATEDDLGVGALRAESRPTRSR